jgi:hypothetical protein
MTPLSSRHSPCLPILDLFTSVLSNQHYHAPCGLLLAAVGTQRRTKQACFMGAPHWDRISAFRGLIDSSLLCSHDQCLGTLSIWPCAGNQDTSALTGSDSLVSCTTPCAWLSKVLPCGVVVAIYGTADEGSTLRESRPDPCAISRRYVFSSSIRGPSD